MQLFTYKLAKSTNFLTSSSGVVWDGGAAVGSVGGRLRGLQHNLPEKPEWQFHLWDLYRKETVRTQRHKCASSHRFTEKKGVTQIPREAGSVKHVFLGRGRLLSRWKNPAGVGILTQREMLPGSAGAQMGRRGPRHPLAVVRTGHGPGGWG